MTIIRQLLEKKGYDIWSISPEASVYEALLLMASQNIGALLVIQEGEIAGVISERDYARKIILHGKTSMETLVREIMTAEVITVSPQKTVEEAMALMTEKRVRHLPVIDDDEIIGVISIGDLVKDIIADQEFMINQLEQYISGKQA